MVSACSSVAEGEPVPSNRNVTEPDLPAIEQVQMNVPCTAFACPEECAIVVKSAVNVPVPLTGEGDAALAAAGTISAVATMPITIASLRMIFSFEAPRRHRGEDLRGGAVCETSGALSLVVP